MTGGNTSASARARRRHLAAVAFAALVVLMGLGHLELSQDAAPRCRTERYLVVQPERYPVV